MILPQDFCEGHQSTLNSLLCYDHTKNSNLVGEQKVNVIDPLGEVLLVFDEEN